MEESEAQEDQEGQGVLADLATWASLVMDLED